MTWTGQLASGFFLKIIFTFREGEGREKERERNISMREERDRPPLTRAPSRSFLQPRHLPRPEIEPDLSLWGTKPIQNSCHKLASGLWRFGRPAEPWMGGLCWGGLQGLHFSLLQISPMRDHASEGHQSWDHATTGCQRQ